MVNDQKQQDSTHAPSSSISDQIKQSIPDTTSKNEPLSLIQRTSLLPEICPEAQPGDNQDDVDDCMSPIDNQIVAQNSDEEESGLAIVNA